MTRFLKTQTPLALLALIISIFITSECGAQVTLIKPYESEKDTSDPWKKFRAPSHGWLFSPTIGVIPYIVTGRAKSDTVPAPLFGSVRLMGAYRTSRAFAWGVIAGVDFNKKQVQVPITLAVRINFHRKRIVPFFDGNIGYLLGYENKTIGHGLNIGYTIGCKFWVTKKLAVLAKAGVNQSFILSESFRNQQLWGIPVSAGIEF